MKSTWLTSACRYSACVLVHGAVSNNAKCGRCCMAFVNAILVRHPGVHNGLGQLGTELPTHSTGLKF
jgi:hypothetical protein